MMTTDLWTSRPPRARNDGVRPMAALAMVLSLTGCVAPVVRQRSTATLPVRSDTAPSDLSPRPRPLATLIAGTPHLSRFGMLARAGGLDRLLAGRGAATVLAPTDAAFSHLPSGTAEALMQPGNRPSLIHLLRYWIVPGRTSPEEIAVRLATGNPVRLPTLDAESVAATAANGATMVTDAAGRHGYIVGGTAASDGALIELNGAIAPRSIEPGVVATGR